MRNLLNNRVEMTDDDILDLYAPPAELAESSSSGAFVRFNFVMTADGGATHHGVSGAIGGEGDKRLFQLLRRHAHVLLMGAGTIRAEGYEGDLLSPQDKAWRAERGLSGLLPVALISGSLRLNPDGPFFKQSPVKPLIYTTESAPTEAREKLAEVAEIIIAGHGSVEPVRVVEDLVSRGFTMIHSEGGPTILGDFQRTNLVDSLCVTIAPKIAGPGEKRIGGEGDATENVLRTMTLHALLEHQGELHTEYRKH